MYTTDNSISLSRDLKREMKAFLPLEDLVSYLSDKLDMSPEEELDSKNFYVAIITIRFLLLLNRFQIIFIKENFKQRFHCMNLMTGCHSFCLYFLVD